MLSIAQLRKLKRDLAQKFAQDLKNNVLKILDSSPHVNQSWDDIRELLVAESAKLLTEPRFQEVGDVSGSIQINEREGEEEFTLPFSLFLPIKILPDKKDGFVKISFSFTLKERRWTAQRLGAWIVREKTKEAKGKPKTKRELEMENDELRLEIVRLNERVASLTSSNSSRRHSSLETGFTDGQPTLSGDTTTALDTQAAEERESSQQAFTSQSNSQIDTGTAYSTASTTGEPSFCYFG
jgi:hypothetical protein